MAERQVDNWQPSSRQRKVRDAVARAFDVKPELLAGRSRLRPVVHARHAACWVIRQLFPELSYPMIGQLFGGRDHSTIIYAVRNANELRNRNAVFLRLTDMLAEGVVLVPTGDPVPPELLARIEAFTAECVAEREREGVDRQGRPVKPSMPARSVMARNDFSEDDQDGQRRSRGTQALLAALDREGAVCR